MCRQAAAKTADPSGPAVLVCYQAKTALLSDDRTGGASALASAAVDASASVDDGHAVLNLHSADGASALASTAADATLRSEERRVGKERETWRGQQTEKKEC